MAQFLICMGFFWGLHIDIDIIGDGLVLCVYLEMQGGKQCWQSYSFQIKVKERERDGSVFPR